MLQQVYRFEPGNEMILRSHMLKIYPTLTATEPSLKVAAESWILAGGAHHTSFSYVVTTDQLLDFAEMVGIECVVIDENTNPLTFRNELRLNNLAWKLL